MMFDIHQANNEMLHHKATHNERLMPQWNWTTGDIHISSNDDEPRGPPIRVDNNSVKYLTSPLGNGPTEACQKNEEMPLSSDGDERKTRAVVVTLASNDNHDDVGKFARCLRYGPTSGRESHGAHRHGHIVNKTRGRSVYCDASPPIPKWVIIQPSSKKMVFMAQNEGTPVPLRDLAMILLKQLDSAIERGWYGPLVHPECQTCDAVDIGVKPDSM
jgi:hypothetical protein